MIYCFDTSSLIDLGERHYPERIDVFSPIWDFIYEGISEGTIVSSDYVKIELLKKADDWREDFLSKADGMFKISEGIEQEYASVILDIESKPEFNENSHRERFLIGADPWVIALARLHGECTVISSESKPLAKYGMGAVCSVLRVEHMSLIEFFEKNEIGNSK